MNKKPEDMTESQMFQWAQEEVIAAASKGDSAIRKAVSKVLHAQEQRLEKLKNWQKKQFELDTIN